jgi:hypothetical protein
MRGDVYIVKPSAAFSSSEDYPGSGSKTNNTFEHFSVAQLVAILHVHGYSYVAHTHLRHSGMSPHPSRIYSCSRVNLASQGDFV